MESPVPLLQIMFLAQAGLQLLLLYWLVTIWRGTGLAVALVLMVPQFGLFYDNFIVGIGSWVGLGPVLEAISWPRFWIHWLMGAWLIIAAGAILRLADIGWAQKKWVMGSFCGLTVFWMLWDLPYFFSKSLYPVCEFGLVRYSTQVAADKFCLSTQVVVPGGGPPWPQLVTCFVVIGAGIVLWVKRSFPWMALGGTLMFISATPPFQALKLDNLGEVLIAGGCIWALAHFSKGRKRATLAREAVTT
jgi:hypothetical protein